MSATKLNPFERQVLGVLANTREYDEGFGYRAFKPIAKRTGLDVKQVRRACRSLARKGLAEFARGLWTDDGEPAGSGYTSTLAGRQFTATLPPDPPPGT